ncbi:hypothetical protein CVT24_007241 [Panaeolus cyanescens]|uniref:DUF6533 domain-containing protein n=1 Tax=Panaeolus cyanescens TaxID=181874 RepID=A0A409YPC2_9AGAR|nr:hypothetical protein CVT24_007241 [Panaeolus cyanescens]
MAIPNDIIAEVMDILAAERPPDPKALGEDMEWAWPPDEVHNPPGRLQVKTFHTLSSFCLHQSRKHIFGYVNLGTFNYHHTCNRPPKHLPTLKLQLAFFAEHTETLSYIRHLSLCVKREEVQDLALQAQLYDMMVQLSNLTLLEITFSNKDWSDVSLSTRSVRSALRTLLRSSENLSEVRLADVVNFCISDLVDAPYLRCLDVYDTSFFVDDNGAKIELNGIKELRIFQYDREKDFEQFVNHLIAKDGDGNLVLTFPKLEALNLDPLEITHHSGMLKIVSAHGGSLQELTFEICLDRQPGLANDRSAWFNEMILPRSQTLKKIAVVSPVNDEVQDPFAGLCSTISRMDEHSPLTVLDIVVKVETDCMCTVGDEWLEFSKALKGNKKLKHLKKVKLVVDVAEFGRSDGSLRRALNGLRETHLKALFSQSFEFEYRVRTIPSSPSAPGAFVGSKLKKLKEYLYGTFSSSHLPLFPPGAGNEDDEPSSQYVVRTVCRSFSAQLPQLSLSVLCLLGSLPSVASLGLVLQPTAIANTSSIVVWSKEQPSDFSIADFDLRFVQGITDVGLAAANIVVRPDAQFGIVTIQFPKAGTFVIKAVTGSPRFTPAGTSNDVTVIELPSNATATTSSHPTPTASSTSSISPASGTVPRLRNVNLPAIVGGILGALILIGLIATLSVFLLRRKHAIKRRWTFHKDMMFRNHPRANTGSTRIPSPPPTLPVLPLPSPSGISDPEMQAAANTHPASISRTPTSRTLFCVPWDKHHPDYDVEHGLPPKSPTSPKTPTSPQSVNIKIPPPIAQNMSMSGNAVPVTLPPGAAAPSRGPARSLALTTANVAPVPQGPRDSSPTRVVPLPAIPVAAASEATGGAPAVKPLPAPVTKPPPPAVVRKLPQPVIRAPNLPPAPSTSTPNNGATNTTSPSSRGPSPPLPIIRTHISITPLSSSLHGASGSSSMGGIITSPARSRRQAEMQERMVQLDGQMKVLEEEDATARALGEEDNHRVVLEDMRKQMVWLKENENGPWAMGTTDTPPPGYMSFRFKANSIFRIFKILVNTSGLATFGPNVAALVVFVCDMFYTLADEVEYIWKCKSVLWFDVIGTSIISPLVVTVLALRVYALYERSRKVLFFVVVLVACEVATQGYIDWNQGRQATREVFLTIPEYPILGCLAFTGRREITLVCWITSFVVAAIFFGMTIYKIRHDALEMGLANSSMTHSRMYQAFIRGGAVSFLCVALVIPINAGVTIWVNNPLVSSSEPWVSLALSLAGTRLIMTLKRADANGEKTAGEQSALGMETWEAAVNNAIASADELMQDDEA